MDSLRQRSHPSRRQSRRFAYKVPSHGQTFEAERGTLEHFLAERYCLYAADSQGRVSRGEIHHPPWQLQIAEAQFQQNSMTEAGGLALPLQKPLLHFARRQDVVAWSPQRF